MELSCVKFTDQNNLHGCFRLRYWLSLWCLLPRFNHLYVGPVVLTKLFQMSWSVSFILLRIAFRYYIYCLLIYVDIWFFIHYSTSLSYPEKLIS